jgi:hypothetical protein
MKKRVDAMELFHKSDFDKHLERHSEYTCACLSCGFWDKGKTIKVGTITSLLGIILPVLAGPQLSRHLCNRGSTRNRRRIRLCFGCGVVVSTLVPLPPFTHQNNKATPSVTTKPMNSIWEEQSVLKERLLKVQTAFDKATHQRKTGTTRTTPRASKTNSKIFVSSRLLLELKRPFAKTSKSCILVVSWISNPLATCEFSN